MSQIWLRLSSLGQWEERALQEEFWVASRGAGLGMRGGRREEGLGLSVVTGVAEKCSGGSHTCVA